MNATAWAAGSLHASVTRIVDGAQTWISSVLASFTGAVEDGFSTIAAILGSISGLIAAVATFILTRELTGSSRWASRRLMHAAVSRLPERRREIRREEWKAEWDSFGDAHLARLLWAAGLWLGAWKIRRRERPAQSTASPTPTVIIDGVEVSDVEWKLAAGGIEGVRRDGTKITIRARHATPRETSRTSVIGAARQGPLFRGRHRDPTAKR